MQFSYIHCKKESEKPQKRAHAATCSKVIGFESNRETMLISTFIATRVGHNRHPWHGYGVGICLFAMVVFNMTQLPYTTWYWILMFAVLPQAAYIGTQLGATNTPTLDAQPQGTAPALESP